MFLFKSYGSLSRGRRVIGVDTGDQLFRLGEGHVFIAAGAISPGASGH